MSMHKFGKALSSGGGFLPLVMICVVGFHSLSAAEGVAPLELSENGRKILTYNPGYQESPEKDAPWFGRSGFIHPVYSPSGVLVTDDFPEGHRHQHGIMFAWTNTIIDGQSVDFWNSHKKQGLVEHAETINADKSEILVKLRHMDLTAKTPKAVIRETWKLTVVPHPTLNIFDFESVMEVNETLHIGGYRYGGLCVRGSAKWAHNAEFITSEGKGRADGNHTRPTWIAMSGKIDGKSAGIACLGNPANFRAPQPVRVHEEFPYFGYAPVVLGDFTIEPKKPFLSRYRFVVFDGEPDPKVLERLWRSYAAEKN